MVLPPLKNISTPCFLQMFLQFSPMPWCVWDNYIGLVVTATFVGVIDCPLISVCLPLLFNVRPILGTCIFLGLY